MASTLGKRLVACLLNVSEARRKDLVVKVAQAAITNSSGGWRVGTTVLNIFNDLDYNRSVITIVASLEHIICALRNAVTHYNGIQQISSLDGQWKDGAGYLESLRPKCMGPVELMWNDPSVREAVLSACEQACGLIDMHAHSGVHPCMGAVDLVPLYPLGEEVGLEDCVKEARVLASEFIQRVDGTSAFFFGWADMPQKRGLAQRRKEMGWFKKNPDMSIIQPDIGPSPQKRYGLTGIGVSPYVMNCNVTIGTQDLALGRRVAAALRESSPSGIPGVQVLALPHEGNMEIACNVESVAGVSPFSSSGVVGGNPWPSFNIGGQVYCHAPASLITTRVAELAGRDSVATIGMALVGFTPRECHGFAVQALSLGIGEFWKEQRKLHM